MRGIGIGEASSDEEKYKWRRAVNDAEFNTTPASRRREKHGRGYDGKPDYTIPQVRTNPADQANTVLKMAKKRSYTDLALTATAASEVFTQDEPPNGAPPKPPRQPARRGHRSAPLASDFGDSANELTEDGKVESIEEQSGTSKGGKAWTRFDIWVNGEVHKTFSDSIVAAAREAEASRAEVSIMYKVGKFGRNVVDLVVHGDTLPDLDEPPPPDDDDAPPW